MDVSDSRSVREGLSSLGLQIDGLVHCAGGFRYLGVEQNSDEELDFLINVNTAKMLNSGDFVL